MAIASASDVYTELNISAPTATEVAVVARAIVFAQGAVKTFLGYDPERRRRVEYYPQQDFNYQHRETIWDADASEAFLIRVAEASTSELQVRHLPVRQIHNLWVDVDGRSGTQSGAFGSSTLQTEGTDYWANYDSEDDSNIRVCLDGLIRSMGRWPITPGTVKVDYTAGYTNPELTGGTSVLSAVPIWTAVVTEAARRAKQVFLTGKQAVGGFIAGPIVAERIGDYQYRVETSMAQTQFSGGATDLMYSTREILADFVNLGVRLAA